MMLTQLNGRIPAKLKTEIDELVEKLKADKAGTQEQWLTAALTTFRRLPITKQKIAIAAVRSEWSKANENLRPEKAQA